MSRGCTTLRLLAVLLLLGGCSEEPPERHPVAEHAGHQAGAGEPAGGVPGMATLEVSPERRQAIGVRTAALEIRSLTGRVRTVGVVAADERRVRKVQTKVSGWVSRLLVNFTGESVSAGQPILAIYSPEVVAGQREYLLALGAKRAQPALAENGLLLDSSRTRLLYWDLSEAQVQALERSGTPHRSVTLQSPISGVVTLKPVYQGMFVTPEMELYTVTDLGSVWVWADLYEQEIGLVRPAQRAKITLAAAPAAPLPATISFVSPTMETATRTLRVRFDVPNGGGRLKPGMYATVEVEVPLGQVLALPEEALIDTGERKVVFVALEGDRFEPREVRVGRKAEGFYEVLSGLASGERVLVSAQFLIDSESRLQAAAGGGPAHGAH
jgi:Cu(I)/Ag(I) efflux system membrane fusion protein